MGRSKKNTVTKIEWKILLMMGMFCFYEVFVVFLWDSLRITYYLPYNSIYLYLAIFNGIYWFIMYLVFKRIL